MHEQLDQELTRDFIQVSGVRTAIYFNHHHPDRETILFVHGIGGDYHGMVPLTCLLSGDKNVILVDLPGHGASGIPTDKTLYFLRIWAHNLVTDLKREGFAPSLTVAHSFGCYVAQYIDTPSVCYINPPITLSYAAKWYATMLYRVRYMIWPVYFGRRFALWRGRQLVHRRTSEALDYVEWITDKTRVSKRQFFYQSKIGSRTATDGVVDFNKTFLHDKTLFVTAKHDQISLLTVDERKIISQMPHLEVDAGHMAIIEFPYEIVEFLREKQSISV